MVVGRKRGKVGLEEVLDVGGSEGRVGVGEERGIEMMEECGIVLGGGGGDGRVVKGRESRDVGGYGVVGEFREEDGVLVVFEGRGCEELVDGDGGVVVWIVGKRDERGEGRSINM